MVLPGSYGEEIVKSSKNNYGYEWFTMVIIDAKTGKILGMSSNPNFDLNFFTKS